MVIVTTEADWTSVNISFIDNIYEADGLYDLLDLYNEYNIKPKKIC